MEPGRGTGMDLRSDADLITAARSGDAGSFGVLYERHAGAALIVARQYTSGGAEAEDAVADAFAAVWSALRGGSGPTDAFRAYLFTVVRRAAAVQRQRGRRADPTDDVAVLESGTVAVAAAEEPALEGFERSIVARAFASLPERWQAVLWHSEIEGQTPAEIAPLLGLTANSTAALAYRAREGLRQAYLQQHLSDELPDGCRSVAGKLGGYVRGGLGVRDTTQVEAHLETCGECRALLLELRDVNHGLRAIVAPIVLGAAGLGALGFVLPTTGGLAAGTAALSSGGATAGAAGAAGTAGAAAAGASVAAGAAGATSGAASGGMLAAIGAFLGTVPTAVAAGVAGVVVVAGITLGALALNAPHGTPSSAGVTSTVTATPDPSALPPASDVDDPTSAPASTPSSAGTADAGTSTSGTSDVSTVVAASGSGAGSGSGGTTAGAPALVVSVPDAVLAAGEGGQALGVDVTNAGAGPATNLVAQVDLPPGVTSQAVTQQVVGRYAVHLASAWDCVIVGTGVRCALPVLDAGQVAHVGIAVAVTQDFTGGEVTWEVSADGVARTLNHPGRLTVTPWASPSPTSSPAPTTTTTSTPTPTATPTPTPTPTPTCSTSSTSTPWWAGVPRWDRACWPHGNDNGNGGAGNTRPTAAS